MIKDTLDQFLNGINEIYKNNLNQQEHRPIYHYTSAYGLKGILLNNSLWFTHFKFLNDRTEKYYTYDLFRRCIDIEKNNIKESFYNEIKENYCYDYNEFNKFSKKFCDFYVLSFSYKEDSLSLWNYYTKNTNKAGYNIKFNAPKLVDIFSNTITNSLLFYKIIYDVNKQIELIKLLIYKFNEYFEESNKIFFTHQLLRQIDYISIRFKHPCFEKEEEARFVFMIEEQEQYDLIQSKLLNFRESNGIIVPYLNINICKESIEGIKISPLQNDFIVKEGLVSILKHLNFNHMYEQDITYSDLPIRF